jgi:hypothetical protein
MKPVFADQPEMTGDRIQETEEKTTHPAFRSHPVIA